MNGHVGYEVPTDMIFVQGGTYEMGGNHNASEQPIHSVTIGNYFIGEHQITQSEWKNVMGENPSCFTGENLPVERVSWYDAAAFCNKKSEKEGLKPAYSGIGDAIALDQNANGYRLPTEAEWEYAARGGNMSKGYVFSGSNSLDEVGWYEANSGMNTHPVGTKKPNELGIFDMSGNVLEWCWDRYGSYGSNPSINPAGPLAGINRVFRGGSWYDDEELLIITDRSLDYADYRDPLLGFRIVRNCIA